MIYLMRGLPGSGKSYRAFEIKNKEGGEIFSTDQFWWRNDRYDYQPNLIGIAHQWNQSRVAAALFQGAETVIIDNTNITYEEMAPYFLLGAKFAQTIMMIEPNTAWKYDSQLCYENCIHNVPLEVIRSMAKRWEPTSKLFNMFLF